jgi:hypothetical protein
MFSFFRPSRTPWNLWYCVRVSGPLQVSLCSLRGGNEDVGFHPIRDRLVEREQRPGVLREMVHEDVIALLRVLPRSSIS